MSLRPTLIWGGIGPTPGPLPSVCRILHVQNSSDKSMKSEKSSGNTLIFDKMFGRFRRRFLIAPPPAPVPSHLCRHAGFGCSYLRGGVGDGSGAIHRNTNPAERNPNQARVQESKVPLIGAVERRRSLGVTARSRITPGLSPATPPPTFFLLVICAGRLLNLDLAGGVGGGGGGACASIRFRVTNYELRLSLLTSHTCLWWRSRADGMTTGLVAGGQ